MVGKQSLREWYDLFVSCSLYLTTSSVSMLVIAGLVLTGEPLAAGIGFVTGPSLMLSIYIADRIDVTDEDRINNPGRTELVQKYYTELLAMTLVSMALFEVTLAHNLYTPTAGGVGRLVLGHVPLFVLYLYDDLKTVRFPLDSLTVAFTWGYMLVFIFVSMTPVTVSPTDGAVLFASWVLIVFAGLEARNIDDIEGDRASDKITLAVLYGPQTTRTVEIVLKTVGGGLLVVYSQQLLVFALVIVHLLSLRVYGTLETTVRSQCNPTRAGDV